MLLWPDAHESEYTCTWLKQRAFNDVNRRHQAAVLQRPERLWTAADMDGRIPRIDYAEVLTADTLSITLRYSLLIPRIDYAEVLTADTQDRLR